MTKDEYVAAIIGAFVSAGKKLALEWLVARIPFFGWPVVNPIMGWIVGLVVEALANQAEMRTFFVYIDIRTNLQAKDFEKACEKLLKASPEEREKREQELMVAFRQFARFTT